MDILGANLFLLNPAGVLFGPNATLAVQGSFHVSTADVVRLADGGRFVADGSAASVLSVADPVAFGFLRANPAGIRIEESVLEVPTGQTLSVVGGDIDIIGGLAGFLRAPSGQIRLTSVTSPSDIIFRSGAAGSGLGLASARPDGVVTLSNAAFLDVSGEVGGALLIRGGNIALEGGSILLADTQGKSARAPGGITIDATGTVMLVEGSFLITRTQGRSAAGGVTITTRDLVVREGSAIGSITVGPSQGGSVTIRVRDTLTVTGSNPVDGSSSGIAAQVFPNASGSAGDVLIDASVLMLAAGGMISSSTFGPGDSGNVTIRVREILTIMGTDPVDRSAGVISAQAEASGSAGDVLIDASMLTLTAGGQIGSSTFGPGDGGSVTIQVRDTLTVTGSDPVDGPPSGIFVNTFGRGQGGDMTVNARQVRLTEGARIEARSTGTGNAGDITITALDTLRSENSAVRTGATEADGGDIRITTQGLMQLSNSQITTAVGSGEGAGGNLTVDAASILLQDSQLNADAFGGPGGNIEITADVLLADPASSITASSARNVDGEIDIRVAVTDLSETVTPLSQDFGQEATLARQCAERWREGITSRFVVASRYSGRPTVPSGTVPKGLYWMGEDVMNPTRQGGNQTETPVLSRTEYRVSNREGTTPIRVWAKDDMACAK